MLPLRHLILSQRPGQVTGMKLAQVRVIRQIWGSTGFCTGTSPVLSQTSVFFAHTKPRWLVFLVLNSSGTDQLTSADSKDLIM